MKETVERNRDKILDLTINQKKSDEELTQGRDTLEQNLSDEVKKLMEQLDQVNNDITGTQKEIMDVLKDINNTDLSRRQFLKSLRVLITISQRSMYLLIKLMRN